jgi:hypothetical protein
VVAERYGFIAKTMEKPLSKGVVSGVSKIKTQQVGIGELTTKGLGIKPVTGGEMKVGKYIVGSKPLSTSKEAIFRKTGFQEFKGTSEGAGVLKIVKPQTSSLAGVKDSFIKVFKSKSGQATLTRQISLPKPDQTFKLGASTTSSSSAVFSQIGLPSKASTYIAGTYGLRPVSAITGAGVFSKQIQTPVSRISSVPMIGQASRVGTAQIPRTVPITEQIPRTVPELVPRTGSITRTTPRTVTIPETITPQPRASPPSTPPTGRQVPRGGFIPINFNLPSLGFGYTLKGGYMMKPQKTKYQASLTGIMRGIRSPSIPRSAITGLGIRPMVTKRRKRKKK